jgi:hypothetical protein
MLKGKPGHIVVSLLGRVGLGFTEATKEKGLPAHPCATGVTVYVACATELMELYNVCVILDTGEVFAEAPVSEPAGTMSGSPH